jgi:uncharacterized membrane protein
VAKRIIAVATEREHSFSRRILDLCLLVGSALVICVLGVAAFAIASLRHVNPIWIFFALISAGFVAGVREEYRREFRSGRFVLFVLAWLVINIAVVVVVVSSFGWFWLFPALFLEQAFFYMSAYWLFGLEPPLRRREGPKS